MLLVTSYHRNWDKLRPDGPLGLKADFNFTFWNTGAYCKNNIKGVVYLTGVTMEHKLLLKSTEYS